MSAAVIAVGVSGSAWHALLGACPAFGSSMALCTMECRVCQGA